MRIYLIKILIISLLIMGSGYASAHTSLASSNSSSHTMFNISGKNVFIKGQYFVFTNSGVSVLKNEHYSNQNRK